MAQRTHQTRRLPAGTVVATLGLIFAAQRRRAWFELLLSYARFTVGPLCHRPQDREARVVASRSRPQRLLRWCRYHPKASGIAAAVVVLFVVAGIVGDDTQHDDRVVAGPGPTASQAPDTPAPSTHTSASSRSVAPASSPSPSWQSRVSVAPADRLQGSWTLAATALAALAVKGRATKTGYDRDQFGTAWTDDNDDPLGFNGGDTRSGQLVSLAR